MAMDFVGVVDGGDFLTGFTRFTGFEISDWMGGEGRGTRVT